MPTSQKENFPETSSTTHQETPKSKRFSYKKFSLLLIFLFVLINGVLLLLLNRLSYKKTTQETTTNQFLTVKTISSQNIFISHVPHFDQLKASDLPVVGAGVRGVFPYKNTLIIVGLNKILIYNPTTKKIISENNNDFFDCSDRADMINNFLYVVCSHVINPNTKTKRGIYKIDLDTGKVVKEYFDRYASSRPDLFKYPPQPIMFPVLVNATLAHKKNTLWVGAWNGVFQIDTVSDAVVFYTPSQLGFSNSCGSFQIYANDAHIWVTSGGQSGCGGGISFFDSASKKWKHENGTNFPQEEVIPDLAFGTVAYSKNNIYLEYEVTDKPNGKLTYRYVMLNPKTHMWTKIFDDPNTSGNDPKKQADDFLQLRKTIFSDAIITHEFGFYPNETVSYFNQHGKPTDFIIPFPKYEAVSNKVDDVYYVFSSYESSDIYIMTRNSFPTYIVTAKEPYTGLPSPLAYVDSTRHYALLFGQRGGIGLDTTLSDLAAIQLIDLQNGNVYDLFDKTSRYGSLPFTSNTTLVSKINLSLKGKLEEIPNGIIIKDAASDQNLLRITFSDHMLEIL